LMNVPHRGLYALMACQFGNLINFLARIGQRRTKTMPKAMEGEFFLFDAAIRVKNVLF
jgi:hypothetical protein